MALRFELQHMAISARSCATDNWCASDLVPKGPGIQVHQRLRVDHRFIELMLIILMGSSGCHNSLCYPSQLWLPCEWSYTRLLYWMLRIKTVVTFTTEIFHCTETYVSWTHTAIKMWQSEINCTYNAPGSKWSLSARNKSRIEANHIVVVHSSFMKTKW